MFFSVSWFPFEKKNPSKIRKRWKFNWSKNDNKKWEIDWKFFFCRRSFNSLRTSRLCCEALTTGWGKFSLTSMFTVYLMTETTPEANESNKNPQLSPWVCTAFCVSRLGDEHEELPTNNHPRRWRLSARAFDTSLSTGPWSHVPSRILVLPTIAPSPSPDEEFSSQIAHYGSLWSWTNVSKRCCEDERKGPKPLKSVFVRVKKPGNSQSHDQDGNVCCRLENETKEAEKHIRRSKGRREGIVFIKKVLRSAWKLCASNKIPCSSMVRSPAPAVNASLSLISTLRRELCHGKLRLLTSFACEERKARR